MLGPTFDRRDILNMAVAASAAPAAFGTPVTADDESPPLHIIDTNVSLFQWPFRRMPLDRTDVLVAKLRSLGVVQAWAGSFEGLLHRDVAGVNQRLAAACEEHADLIPIGTINPASPGWNDDLDRCITEHNMPGIRLHPNYHRYSLTDARFTELLSLATDAGLLVQITVAMEDTRTQHSLVRVPDVDLGPLSSRNGLVRGARVQILNARLQPAELKTLSSNVGIFFDTARVDGTDGVPSLLNSVPRGRVLFGSHAPFLIPEAALIRVHESGRLDQSSLAAVLSGNARSVLGESTS
jgi:predicted TIM-barrel fold metal-dependent hydrolase